MLSEPAESTLIKQANRLKLSAEQIASELEGATDETNAIAVVRQILAQDILYCYVRGKSILGAFDQPARSGSVVLAVTSDARQKVFFRTLLEGENVVVYARAESLSLRWGGISLLREIFHAYLLLEDKLGLHEGRLMEVLCIGFEGQLIDHISAQRFSREVDQLAQNRKWDRETLWNERDRVVEQALMSTFPGDAEPKGTWEYEVRFEKVMGLLAFAVLDGSSQTAEDHIETLSWLHRKASHSYR